MNTLWIAGGCFWGVEAYFKQIKGIVKTETGYLNGNSAQTNYQKVCQGSGHAEVVQITYNHNQITLADIFKLFINIIDPFQINGQGNDIGIQYRTGLYTKDKQILSDLKKLLKAWEKSHKPTPIEIKPVINYVKAENMHQDYLKQNPNGYCHINLNTIPKKWQK